MMKKSAIIDETGCYRYLLTRIWDERCEVLGWLMLNPSTADAGQDDHTIRKCMGFARRHGFGGIAVVNLFAYRATNPKELIGLLDPIGPENDRHIIDTRKRVGAMVAGWGGLAIQGRDATVRKLLAPYGPLLCLGVTMGGGPLHPSRPGYDRPLVEFAQ